MKKWNRMRRSGGYISVFSIENSQKSEKSASKFWWYNNNLLFLQSLSKWEVSINLNRIDK